MPDDFRGRAFALFDIAYNVGFIVPAMILSLIWVENSEPRRRFRPPRLRYPLTDSSSRA